MEEIVCDGCSLLCDDVSVETEGKEVRSYGFCRLGHTHLVSALEHVDVSDQSLEKAADILISAEKLLIYGFSKSTNEAIQESLALAETLNAHFDSGANLGLSQAMKHEIHSHSLDADLEYVRNNGEFILYWGSNPTESSHRHPSRFAVLPRGEKIPEGVESRRIGVVDVRETETMKMANHRIIIPIGSDPELLQALTSEISGESSIKDSVAGIAPAELIGLARGLKNSDCTVFFYGTGIINSGDIQENLSSLSKLIAVLRSSGKEAYAIPMWHSENAMGVVKTATDTSSESSLQKLVANEFDVVLVVGEDPLVTFPGNAAKALSKSKLLYIGQPGGLTDRKSSLSIHTIDNILTESSTMTRIDMVDIELKPWSKSADSSKGMYRILVHLHELVKGKTSSQ